MSVKCVPARAEAMRVLGVEDGELSSSDPERRRFVFDKYTRKVKSASQNRLRESHNKLIAQCDSHSPLAESPVCRALGNSIDGIYAEKAHEIELGFAHDYLAQNDASGPTAQQAVFSDDMTVRDDMYCTSDAAATGAAAGYGTYDECLRSCPPKVDPTPDPSEVGPELNPYNLWDEKISTSYEALLVRLARGNEDENFRLLMQRMFARLNKKNKSFCYSGHITELLRNPSFPYKYYGDLERKHADDDNAKDKTERSKLIRRIDESTRQRARTRVHLPDRPADAQLAKHLRAKLPAHLLARRQFGNALFRHASTVAKTCSEHSISVVSIEVCNGGTLAAFKRHGTTHANLLLFWYEKRGWSVYLLDPHGVNSDSQYGFVDQQLREIVGERASDQGVDKRFRGLQVFYAGNIFTHIIQRANDGQEIAAALQYTQGAAKTLAKDGLLRRNRCSVRRCERVAQHLLFQRPEVDAAVAADRSRKNIAQLPPVRLQHDASRLFSGTASEDGTLRFTRKFCTKHLPTSTPAGQTLISRDEFANLRLTQRQQPAATHDPLESGVAAPFVKTEREPPEFAGGPRRPTACSASPSAKIRSTLLRRARGRPTSSSCRWSPSTSCCAASSR
jgi:hypothetical protein